VPLPPAIGATKVANLIIRPTAKHRLEQLRSQSDINDALGLIGLQFGALDVGAGSSWVNQTLSGIEVRSHHGDLIVGIRHADDSTVLNPSSDTKLSAGNVAIGLGHDDDIPQLAARLSSSRNKITYRGVAIEAEYTGETKLPSRTLQSYEIVFFKK
jgi:voltage-gated potassium channel